MSNELALTATLRYAKDEAAISVSLSDSIDVSGSNFIHHSQLVGTSEELLYLGDVTQSGGYFVAINRDPTNEIRIRPDTTLQALARLKPSEFCVFRMEASATPYVIAVTASCLLEYWLFEN